MNTLGKLTEVARSIVTRGCELARDVEVRIVRSDGYGYDIRNRELAPEVALGRVSVGIRALSEGGMSLAATTTLDVQTNLDALAASLASARPTPLTAFGDGSFEASDEGHHERWDDWARDPRLLRELARELRDVTWRQCESSGRLESFEGGVSFGTSWTVLATRHGHAAFKRTSGGVFARINSGHYSVRYLLAPPDDAELPELHALGVKTFEEIPERVVTPADFGVSSGESVPVILHPSLVESMLRYGAQEKFLGSSVRTGMTQLETGLPVWDRAITLRDSGSESGLASARPCDDELVATSSTPLVESGVFQHHVWSRRSAAEASRQSTGNGYRYPMLVEEPSEAPVRDKLSALVMEPGETPRDALFESLDRGIFVHACLGLHGADRARASFSTTVYDGFAIEKGRITAQLAPGAWNMAGHLFPEKDSGGLFSEVTLTRERWDASSSRLPWVQTRITVG